MSRRSTPQAQIDQNAFPVVVRVLVPGNGFGPNDPSAWLRRELRLTEFATTSFSSLIGDAVAFHFRCLEDAYAFRAQFPMLVLADSTLSHVYRSPHLPFGREEEPMCNLYSMTRAQEAMRQLFAPKVLRDRTGNLPPLPEIYPDQFAPILRNGTEGLEMVMARWGMPTPPQFLLGKKTDRGCTNVRNAKSPHWRQWLLPAHRCLVPFNKFAEPSANGNVWFALPDDQPAFFAGVWTRWTSVRKLKDGETSDDLYAFLTTEPNAEVAAIHPKAMPVILTTAEQWDAWLTAPWPAVAGFQRPLANGALQMVDGETPVPT